MDISIVDIQHYGFKYKLYLALIVGGIFMYINFILFPRRPTHKQVELLDNLVKWKKINSVPKKCYRNFWECRRFLNEYSSKSNALYKLFQFNPFWNYLVFSFGVVALESRIFKFMGL